jgi:hypothetical protein
MVQAIAASFWPTINSDGVSITLEAGDVVLGPGTWQQIAESTPSVTSTNTHVWLEIPVDGGSAVMQVGTKAAMMAAMIHTSIHSQNTIAAV